MLAKSNRLTLSWGHPLARVTDPSDRRVLCSQAVLSCDLTCDHEPSLLSYRKPLLLSLSFLSAGLKVLRGILDSPGTHIHAAPTQFPAAYGKEVAKMG
jgi:hypothetical protein